jgi:glycosyltransferase involved in cell wall biosynthesis
VDAARVHVIPHGALSPWEGEEASALPAELGGADGPVALFFGLLRPYKGVDLLLDAWRGIAAGGLGDAAELWIVGMPRMDITSLKAAAPPGVRFLSRFVSDAEILALMRRASFVVLPYREIDQSGVAFTALGAGAPLLLSDVGGFPELAATGAARTFAAGDARGLRRHIEDLLAHPAALAEMSACAGRAADGEYSWTGIAQRTLALYAELVER